MVRDNVIAALRAHEAELKAAGVISLAVFGSVARGESGASSDVDLVVRLSEDAQRGGFAYFDKLDALRSRLTSILGLPVDVIAEPVHKEDLRRAIEAERAVAF